jgi:hypothetical protein
LNASESPFSCLPAGNLLNLFSAVRHDSLSYLLPFALKYLCRLYARFGTVDSNLPHTRIGENRLVDFSIPFRHIHADEIDSSSMGTVSDDLSHPNHDRSVGGSCRVEPSPWQYTDEDEPFLLSPGLASATGRAELPLQVRTSRRPESCSRSAGNEPPFWEAAPCLVSEHRTP